MGVWITRLGRYSEFRHYNCIFGNTHALMLQTDGTMKKAPKVNYDRKSGRKIYLRGTPISIRSRILDHLYQDLREKRIDAMLLICISKDLNQVIYNY